MPLHTRGLPPAFRSSLSPSSWEFSHWRSFSSFPSFCQTPSCSSACKSLFQTRSSLFKTLYSSWCTALLYTQFVTQLGIGIYRCTGEPRYFLSRYEYRYLNGISLYRKTTKYLSSKIKKLLYQHSEITVLISFMTPYPSTSLFLATGLRHCLVSLPVLQMTYFSQHYNFTLL